MALINCPECGKEVSDKATVCPSCAFPLVKQQQHVVTSTAAEQTLAFPGLPADLNIGKPVGAWNSDYYIGGEYVRDENLVVGIQSGKIDILRCQKGIAVKGAGQSWLKILPIHDSQIISFKSITRGELVAKDKSVIGRAAVGSLIMGPLGAVVGGMSALNKSESIKDISYFVINYWDKDTKSAQTLLLRADKEKIQSFIAAYAKPVVKKGMPGILIFCICVVLFLAALFFFF